MSNCHWIVFTWYQYHHSSRTYVYKRLSRNVLGFVTFNIVSSNLCDTSNHQNIVRLSLIVDIPHFSQIYWITNLNQMHSQFTFIKYEAYSDLKKYKL